ncbi:tungsten ABC transporter permease [Azoarcus sp. DD4]|nr:tungsten ABC transporter permease [Azoarcus sp. DD4]
MDKVMTRCLARLLPALVLLCAAAAAQAAGAVKVVVVGGIHMSGVWDALQPRLEAGTGLKIELVGAANKEGIIPAFERGDAELLLVHGGSQTFALQAAGIGGAMRVWGYNEHAVVGPAEDPAGVREAPDAVAAFRRIAAARVPFVASRDPGSHEIVQRLWKEAGIRADAMWVRLDDSLRPQQVVELAGRQRAYVVVGAIPVAFGKMRGEGMEILLRGDPRMRRAYVALEPGSAHPASAAARKRARRLADFLVSPAGQAALAAADAQAGGPWIYGLAGAPAALSLPAE